MSNRNVNAYVWLSLASLAIAAFITFLLLLEMFNGGIEHTLKDMAAKSQSSQNTK